jgi:hypothetical protein
VKGQVRRTAAKVVLLGALAVHGVLLVRGESDPHKLFGFRPFNESDSWQFDVVRVQADGTRRPVDDGTWVYNWDDLVGTAKLYGEGRRRHAAAGAPASIDFLERSLDWILDNIPEDDDTVALEAQVTVFRNGRGPALLELRSER